MTVLVGLNNSSSSHLLTQMTRQIPVDHLHLHPAYPFSQSLSMLPSLWITLQDLLIAAQQVEMPI